MYIVHNAAFCVLAHDGLELEKLPKVKVLRNDKREGLSSGSTSTSIAVHVASFPISTF